MRNHHSRKALVVHIIHKENFRQDASYKLKEAENLTQSLGLEVANSIIIEVSIIKSSSFMGLGKMEMIKELISQDKIDYIVINESISSIQQRNLEKFWESKIIDRTNLILQIFASRAKTSEGKLQVELAQLEYQKSRLIRTWTHLGRQRGGTSFVGGEGETQLEMDKRIIKDKIKKIKTRLEKVKQTRAIQRSSRNKVPYPLVALVGYTNAGKSSLFNLLTGSEVEAVDKLFSTLDPTMRLVSLPSKRQFILSDTVGFISDLPTILVASFRATLEEVIQADIILHVRDFANDQTENQKEDVIKILQQLEIEDKINHSTIEILNKCDLLEENELNFLREKMAREENSVIISVKNRISIERLLEIIDKKLAVEDIYFGISVNIAETKIISFLYDHSEIVRETNKNEYLELYLRISPKNLGKLNSL